MSLGNGSHLLPVLQQDLINNVNSGQSNRSLFFAVGRAPVVNNTRVDVWEGPTGTYVFPSVAQQMLISSSNANDIFGGTGAQSVFIHYLDENWLPDTEIVILNGVTAVQTKSKIMRVQLIHSWEVGSGGVPAGNISLTDLAGAVTYGFISAGHNTSRQAIISVPGDSYGYISHWQGSSGTAAGTHFTIIDVRCTSHNGTITSNRTFLYIDGTGVLNSCQVSTLPIPIRVPPKCDIKVSTESDAVNANAIVMATIFGWFEKVRS